MDATQVIDPCAPQVDTTEVIDPCVPDVATAGSAQLQDGLVSASQVPAGSQGRRRARLRGAAYYEQV